MLVITMVMYTCTVAVIVQTEMASTEKSTLFNMLQDCMLRKSCVRIAQFPYEISKLA